MSRKVLRLEGELTIYRALEFKAQLLSEIAPATTLELNLAAVTELDTSGVQLLMLAQRCAAERGGVLRLAAPSPAVTEVFSLLDLAAHFSISQPTAA